CMSFVHCCCAPRVLHSFLHDALPIYLTPLLGRYRWVGVGAAYPSRSVYRSPPWPVLVSRDPWRGRFLPARRGLGWREPHGHLVTAYAAVKHWCARGRYPRV